MKALQHFRDGSQLVLDGTIKIVEDNIDYFLSYDMGIETAFDVTLHLDTYAIHLMKEYDFKIEYRDKNYYIVTTKFSKRLPIIMASSVAEKNYRKILDMGVKPVPYSMNHFLPMLKMGEEIILYEEYAYVKSVSARMCCTKAKYLNNITLNRRKISMLSKMFSYTETNTHYIFDGEVILGIRKTKLVSDVSILEAIKKAEVLERTTFKVKEVNELFAKISTKGMITIYGNELIIEDNDRAKFRVLEKEVMNAKSVLFEDLASALLNVAETATLNILGSSIVIVDEDTGTTTLIRVGEV